VRSVNPVVVIVRSTTLADTYSEEHWPDCW
jgi:hypothetical protein